MEKKSDSKLIALYQSVAVKLPVWIKKQKTGK